jgi:hypothetical protein
MLAWADQAHAEWHSIAPGKPMQIPFAEAHMALDGTTAPNPPRLGETVALNAQVQRAFFDTISREDRPLFLLTVPCLVRSETLAGLDDWQDWFTLGTYLRQHSLEPCLVFRNQPQRLVTEVNETVRY